MGGVIRRGGMGLAWVNLLRVGVPQHGLRNAMKRENFPHRTEKDGLARHAKDNTTRFILGNGEGVGALHLQEAVGAVIAHPGQQHADGVSSGGLRHGAKKHVHARPVAGDQGPFTNFKKVSGAHPVDVRVPLSRSDIGTSGHNRIAIGGFPNFDRTAVVQTPRERPGKAFGHVLHGHDPRAIRRHPFKQVQQRFRATGGGADGDDLLRSSGGGTRGRLTLILSGSGRRGILLSPGSPNVSGGCGADGIFQENSRFLQESANSDSGFRDDINSAVFESADRGVRVGAR